VRGQDGIGQRARVAGQQVQRIGIEHQRLATGQHAREQGTRMQASVDRYLAAGLAADHRQRTDVATVGQALCRLMARVHGERGIAFTAEGIDPALQFAGASADLEEMLGNLLDNAGRWAQQQVTVEAEAHDGQLRIEVRDDGPGLAADALSQVTQRGVRLDEREGSSGLGLAIVGDIAASYGGRQDIAHAARVLASEVAAGRLQPETPCGSRPAAGSTKHQSYRSPCTR